MTMFATIVWATDGSARSVASAPFVREICGREASSLRIVHVARALHTGAGERRVAKLKAMTSSMRRHGVNASLHVVRGAIGSPAPHIAEVARMADADLLIVTAHDRWPVTTALGAGVIQGLLAHAPCPVLVLPEVAVTAGALSRPEALRPAEWRQAAAS